MLASSEKSIKWYKIQSLRQCITKTKVVLRSTPGQRYLAFNVFMGGTIACSYVRLALIADNFFP